MLPIFTVPIDFINSGELSAKLNICGRSFTVTRIPPPDLDCDKKLLPFLAIIDNFFTEEDVNMHLLSRDFKSPGFTSSSAKMEDCVTLENGIMDIYTDEKYSEYKDKIDKLISPLVGKSYYTHIKRYTSEKSSKVGIFHHIDESPYTLIVYLNDVADNCGHTNFINFNTSVKPIKGRAVWFRTYTGDRQDAILKYYLGHIGEPVTSGEKIIAQFMTHFWEK